MTGYKTGSGTLEIHPCDACSFKIIKAEREKKARQTSQCQTSGFENEAIDGDLSVISNQEYHFDRLDRFSGTGFRNTI